MENKYISPILKHASFMVLFFAVPLTASQSGPASSSSSSAASSSVASSTASSSFASPSMSSAPAFVAPVILTLEERMLNMEKVLAMVFNTDPSNPGVLLSQRQDIHALDARINNLEHSKDNGLTPERMTAAFIAALDANKELAGKFASNYHLNQALVTNARAAVDGPLSRVAQDMATNTFEIIKLSNRIDRLELERTGASKHHSDSAARQPKKEPEGKEQKRSSSKASHEPCPEDERG